MFTDIVGYTKLMGSDEDRAFEVLKKNRKIHSKLISFAQVLDEAYEIHSASAMSGDLYFLDHCAKVLHRAAMDILVLSQLRCDLNDLDEFRIASQEREKEKVL